MARSEQKLDSIADELRSTHGVAVSVFPLDRAAPGADERLREETVRLGIEVDVLVNNAGFATHGDVAEASAARLAEQIQLNCVTLAAATTRFLPSMPLRRRGTIINISSTAAFQPIPHMAVYGASKAFVLSFTEALWAETRDTGVRVLAVCPGSTDTPFFEVAGEAAAVGSKRTTTQLLDNVFRTLPKRKPSLVDGLGNAFVARFLTRVLPKRAILAIAGGSVSA